MALLTNLDHLKGDLNRLLIKILTINDSADKVDYYKEKLEVATELEEMKVTNHKGENITKYVLQLLQGKINQKQFEKFIDKLYSSGIQELKIIENFAIQENDEFEAEETENTINILNRYIEESEIDIDKSIIQKMLQEVYREACELI